MRAKRITLDSVCEKKIATLPSQYEGQIDYVDISSVDNISKQIINTQVLSAKEAPSRAKQLLTLGDILISTVRPNLNAVAMVRTQTDNLLVGSTGYCVLRCNDNVDKRYVFHFCQSPYFVDDMTSQATGASYPAVSSGIVRSSTIPFYSIEEQCAIADTLDKVSELISLRKQQLTKLDELVKARFVELFENEGYEKVTVSSVLDTGFWLMPATPEFIADGEVPYITSKNIKNRTIDFDNVKYISKEAYKSISANRPTQKGDILVSMIGTLGQTAVIQDDREFYGQNLYLLRLNNSIVDTTYFCEFFNSDMAQHELQGKRNQSTQAYLKANHVEDLILPLAPLAIQKQFADFVKPTDKSKLAIRQSLDKLELLKKALMQEYFG